MKYLHEIKQNNTQQDKINVDKFVSGIWRTIEIQSFSTERVRKKARKLVLNVKYYSVLLYAYINTIRRNAKIIILITTIANAECCSHLTVEN